VVGVKVAPTSARLTPLPDVKGVRIPERTLPLLRDLVHQQTGMYYDDTRLDLLSDRLVPLAVERGFDSLLDYYYLLKYDPMAAPEWARVIDSLSVQETYFWREFDQVRALTDIIVPRLIAMKRQAIRIWSLPCATGEEPLSLAMALAEAGWFDRIRIEIHAADASGAALERARSGRFGARAFRQLPEALRDKYFRPSDDQREWVVSGDLHRRVQSWTKINAVQRDELGLLRGADVVFCRNMFIYFQESRVRQVVSDLAALLSSPGFLCVGAAESLLRLTTEFELQDLAGAYVYVKP
jgi:chemotaxis protein methyltransferase CheR